MLDTDNIQTPTKTPDCLLGKVTQPSDSWLRETKVMSACVQVAPPVVFHIFPTGVATGHSVSKLLPVVLVFYKR